MEITEFVEKNASLLRLGLHLEYNDARHRIANHLQRNIDRSKYPKYETQQPKSRTTQKRKQLPLFFLYRYIFSISIEISIVNFFYTSTIYFVFTLIISILNDIHFNWRHRIQKK